MSGCGLPSGWRSRNILAGEADWGDPTGHAVVPPDGSKVAAGTRSGHQYRTPLPGRVPPGEMLAHAGLQDDVSVSTIRALRECDGPDVPRDDGHLTIRLPLIERGVTGRGAVQSSPGKAILMSSGATASPPTTEVSQKALAFSRSPSALAAIPEEVQGIGVVRSATEGVERCGAVG
jgi:hypothetical protein